MNRAARATMLAAIMLSYSASCNDESRSAASPPDTVSSSEMDVAFPDLPPADEGLDDGSAGEMGADSEPDSELPDVPGEVEEDRAPDVGELIWVQFDPIAARCADSRFYGGPLEVTLRWSTEEETVCDITVSINGGAPQLVTVGDGSAQTHHEHRYDLTSFAWSDAPPALGDPVVWTAQCTSTSTGASGSASTSLSVSMGYKQCIWPYDDGCSDGTLVDCALALPYCDPGLVPIAINRCVQCAYPSTCSCDDGSVLACEPEPECPIDQVAAITAECYQCVNRYTCTSGEEECGRFVSAKADCSYQWYQPAEEGRCPQTNCLDERCLRDADCPIAGLGEAGASCVLGSCAFCWEDTQCDGSLVCRGGRCVESALFCPRTPSCTDERCGLVTPSEGPCPVCVCDSTASISCEQDTDCQIISHHSYQNCVFGRCADCRNDDDCEFGSCLPPGICFDMDPHPETLYGTWLIGWAGGLDHFSYFRFEPDGTFRRGVYESDGGLLDDIPSLPCDVREWPIPYPLVGTWEPEITASGFLVVEVTLNLICDDGEGWNTRFSVAFSEDGSSATFDLVGADAAYQGARVPAHVCTGDMSFCRTPG